MAQEAVAAPLGPETENEARRAEKLRRERCALDRKLANRCLQKESVLDDGNCQFRTRLVKS